jgi:hypothetical protein
MSKAKKQHRAGNRTAAAAARGSVSNENIRASLAFRNDRFLPQFAGTKCPRRARAADFDDLID